MSVIRAGTELAYTVTCLEMTARPAHPPPPLPADARLEAARAPPVWYFLALYDAVGRDYEWVDRFSQDPADLAAFVHSPEVSIHTLIRDGWPQGFFVLDWREPGICDLAYFGLAPEAVGKGLGTALLQAAVSLGWDRPGVYRLTVNTCTLDHPRALGTYRKAGFVPVGTKDSTRILTRDRDTARRSA